MTASRTDTSSARATGPLARLAALGQVVWLDYLRRDFLLQGGLRALIERDGVRGVNSDTTTFTQAIAWTGQYDAAVAEWIRRGETDTVQLYERLAVADIQATADQLRDVYERTDRRDGYVSLAVSPRLAHDTDGTIAEADRLWGAVERPNLMLKVAATPAGIAALGALVERGYNVNVGLVGGIELHARVVDAFQAALERRSGELAGIACVASVPVGRIDQLVDDWLAAHLPGRDQPAAFGGRVGVALAQVTYRQWKRLHSGRRWTTLAARGARPQRVLYAPSVAGRTAAADPHYADALIGRETISSMSIAMLDAFRAHGTALPTLEQEPQRADAVLAAAGRAGLDLAAVAATLVDDGVAHFGADFDVLLAALERKRAEVQTGLPPLNPPRADAS